jgi:hypothetical protein
MSDSSPSVAPQLPTAWLASPEALLPSSHKTKIEPALMAISITLATLVIAFVITILSTKSARYLADMAKEATDAENTPRRRLHISDPIPLTRRNTTAPPRRSSKYTGASMQNERNVQVNTLIPLSKNPRHQSYIVPAPAPIFDSHSRRNTNVGYLRPIVTVDQAPRSPRDLDDETVVGGKEEIDFVDSGSEDGSYNGEKRRRGGHSFERRSFQLVSNAEAGIPLGGHWESR